jgi:hypothetical protein
MVRFSDHHLRPGENIPGFRAWYAEFLLEIDLKILLRKTGARLNLKTELIFVHIEPDL